MQHDPLLAANSRLFFNSSTTTDTTQRQISHECTRLPICRPHYVVTKMRRAASITSRILHEVSYYSHALLSLTHRRDLRSLPVFRHLLLNHGIEYTTSRGRYRYCWVNEVGEGHEYNSTKAHSNVDLLVIVQPITMGSVEFCINSSYTMHLYAASFATSAFHSSP
jgi:hypothetical protein